MATKKLINDVESVVDDCLLGLCFTHPGLKIVKGHRIVVRSDYTEVKKNGRVALMSGGGSGHEPAHGGYVGPGMLTAAVAGAVFTSPPPSDCLAAIRLIGENNAGGVLVIVKNYTGDRLNFGFAVEKAKSEGIKVSMFVVADDKALDASSNSVGARGLCGTLFIHKIVGAMAEKGASLEKIVSTLEGLTAGLGTIGLSLSPCSLPGRGPSFELKNDKMELGLGIHGEAGVKRLNLTPAKRAVELMLDHLTRDQNGLRLSAGDRVAIIVNNLGGTSVLELNIVAKEIVSQLRTVRGLIVDRVYSGSLMTSLEMAGVSITVLRLKDDLVSLLDAPTTAPAWPTRFAGPGGCCCVATDGKDVFVDVNLRQDSLEGVDSTTRVGASLDERTTTLVKSSIDSICGALIESEEVLNALDSESGDGDCGTTHARVAKAIRSAQLTFSVPATLLTQLAHIAQESMGGSSGAVYSLGLVAGAKFLEPKVDAKAWAGALEEALRVVSLYGKAQPGDRTLLDALVPALAALRKHDAADVCQILKEMTEAAHEGALSTQTMLAKAGRACYVAAERQTQPDPGAFAVYLWLDAISKACG